MLPEAPGLLRKVRKASPKEGARKKTLRETETGTGKERAQAASAMRNFERSGARARDPVLIHDTHTKKR